MNKLKIILQLCFLFFSLQMMGTHIRGGYITAKKVQGSSFTYEFTFIGYRDTDSGIQFGNGLFSFGDGVFEEANFQIVETMLSENLVLAEIQLIHTFPGPGSYTASYREEFRNAEIANIANSVLVPFYVETMINIDPILGEVSSGELNNIPIFNAEVGKAYYYSPEVIDTDQDRLVFGLALPKQGKDTIVNDYLQVNDEQFYRSFNTGNQTNTGAPRLAMINSVGTLIWDAPGDWTNQFGNECVEGASGCAQYSLAFYFEEYRTLEGQEFLTSRTLVDFQVIVSENQAHPEPTLDMEYKPCLTDQETLLFSLDSESDYSWRIESDLDIMVNGLAYDVENFGSLIGRNDYEVSLANFERNSLLRLEVFPFEQSDENKNVGRFEHGNPDSSAASASLSILYADSCPDLIVDVDDPFNSKVLYPNPARNQIELALGQFENDTNYSIYDLQGKILQEGYLDGNVINISNLDEGQYILRLIDFNEIPAHFRFIKKK